MIPKSRSRKRNGMVNLALAFLLSFLGYTKGHQALKFNLTGKVWFSWSLVDTKSEVREGFFHASVVFWGSARSPLVTLTFKPPKSTSVPQV